LSNSDLQCGYIVTSSIIYSVVCDMTIYKLSENFKTNYRNSKICH